MILDKSNPIIAVYPGSFDPVTNGHLDLIARGAMIFDRLVVAVTHNVEKDPLFAVNERDRNARSGDVRLEECRGGGVFEGLLVDFARAKGSAA